MSRSHRRLAVAAYRSVLRQSMRLHFRVNARFNRPASIAVFYLRTGRSMLSVSCVALRADVCFSLAEAANRRSVDETWLDRQLTLFARLGKWPALGAFDLTG